MCPYERSKVPLPRILIALCAGLCHGLPPARRRSQPPRKLDFFVGAGALYDDNLFRQPAGADLSAIARICIAMT